MSKPFLRFGFHDFLNAQPLLVPLARLAPKIGIKMVLDAPAVIAEKLKIGQLDLGMIPSVEYLKHADCYRLFPGNAIASRGLVRTVILVTQKPLEEIHTLALDNRSLTSAALLRVLFKNQFPEQIQFFNSDPDLKAMLETFDAALIIGDQAFKAKKQFPKPTVFDLSEEWFIRTKKTFVHAVVAVRQGIEISTKTLQLVRDIKSEEAIPEIVRSWSGKAGIIKEECEDYLRNKIIYRLGEAELEGLKYFHSLCLDQGIIEEEHPIQFIDY